MDMFESKRIAELSNRIDELSNEVRKLKMDRVKILNGGFIRSDGLSYTTEGLLSIGSSLNDLLEFKTVTKKRLYELERKVERQDGLIKKLKEEFESEMKLNEILSNHIKKLDPSITYSSEINKSKVYQYGSQMENDQLKANKHLLEEKITSMEKEVELLRSENNTLKLQKKILEEKLETEEKLTHKQNHLIKNLKIEANAWEKAYTELSTRHLD